jgi:hypothetical protein
MTSCGEGSLVGWSRGGKGKVTLSRRAPLGKKVALNRGSVF